MACAGPTARSSRADVILWCTGFRSSLDHLAPLMLREPNGGIVMTGRLATQVAKDPRIHLVGYGPSASTIGANRAGAAAASRIDDVPWIALTGVEGRSRSRGTRHARDATLPSTLATSAARRTYGS